MNELSFYPVAVAAYCVEQRATRRAGGLWAVSARLAKLLESLAKRALRHGLIAVVAVRREVMAVACDLQHAAEQCESLDESGKTCSSRILMGEAEMRQMASPRTLPSQVAPTASLGRPHVSHMRPNAVAVW